jgi:hypothetical protein
MYLTVFAARGLGLMLILHGLGLWQPAYKLLGAMQNLASSDAHEAQGSAANASSWADQPHGLRANGHLAPGMLTSGYVVHA